MQSFIIPNTIQQGSLLADNVAIAIIPLQSGTTLALDLNVNITLKDDIPEGGSFNIFPLKSNEYLISFGVAFAKTTIDIEAGCNITDKCREIGNEVTHQRNHHPNSLDYKFSDLKINFPSHFMGYFNYQLHSQKIIGIENNVIILGMVDCVGPFCQNLALLSRKSHLDKFPNVTDLFSITPGSGCGMPAGAPRDELRKILVSIMNHPNVSHILAIGLGCEQISMNAQMLQNDLDYFKTHVVEFDRRVSIEILQNYSDEFSGIEQIIHKSLLPILDRANQVKRDSYPISNLTIGVKCGGSDRFSALTSNRVIGAIADQMALNHGRIIITETPEFEGVFSLMAQRSVTPEVSQWVLGLEHRFEQTTQSYPIASTGKQHIAPGNKAGGLINAKLKSAGAMIKAGTTPLVAGLEYTDNIWEHDKAGLYLLNGPSYDPISTTALFLSGAQVVLFSTGRGTPLSCALGPVIKLGNRQSVGLSGHVDFVSEGILHGCSLEETTKSFTLIFENIISGKKQTKAREQSELVFKAGGSPTHREFHMWKRWGDN